MTSSVTGRNRRLGHSRALDPRLLADAPHPFVAHSGRIAGLAGLAALESARIDVLAAAKERPEQRDLGTRWRNPIDGRGGVAHRLNAPLSGERVFPTLQSWQFPDRLARLGVRQPKLIQGLRLPPAKSAGTQQKCRLANARPEPDLR